jgi:hypothetical protein
MSGVPIANRARSYGSPSTSTECSRQFRAARSKVAKCCCASAPIRNLSKEMGRMAVLLGVRVGSRNPYQSASAVGSPQGHVRTFLSALFSAMAAVALLGSPASSADANDVRNITVRVGPQLEEIFKERQFKDPNIHAATTYFEGQKLKPYIPGLTELTVQNFKTNEINNLFIMPFAESTPVPGQQHVVVSAAGAKGSAVVLGTILEAPAGSTDPKEQKPPVVKEEYRVIDGKVQPGNHALAKWILCTLGTCMTGVACFAAGPDPIAVGCLCFVCAGGAITCSKDLLD